ncbi:unnamed protein product [Tilletia laevis]|uniref:Uncharacterized protein n=2 Tax=Tilletia TaxID=13289 RepID=A0A177VA27_9BASI|nr:hypothetical protein CF336_g6405 [Tilletia laevis]KAE8246032.1 hypothetical protein A4X03_0g7352 [Tilletia caries]CAD6975465.1 unnamed protein product [Tilletia controversa]KAE8205730.1 hypothetical protein CF335_g2205 [Tilletia laevis]CAD6891377.1 unnamed protein product [Tilletia caries]
MLCLRCAEAPPPRLTFPDGLPARNTSKSPHWTYVKGLEALAANPPEDKDHSGYSLGHDLFGQYDFRANFRILGAFSTHHLLLRFLSAMLRLCCIARQQKTTQGADDVNYTLAFDKVVEMVLIFSNTYK